MASLPKYITSEAVRRVLKMKDLIPVIETAMGNFSKGVEGGVVQPPRHFLPYKDNGGYLLVMAGSSHKDQAISTKLVSRFFENGDTDKVVRQDIIIYTDPNDGLIKSIMDAEDISLMRTAAASAVATKYLAPKDSKILCLLGAGGMARAHYTAMHCICDFKQTRVWSRTFASAQTFATEFNAVACETVEEAARDADVIVTATWTTTPVLQYQWVKPGAHINCIGAVRPNKQELSSELMQNSIVYADSKASALAESGDIIISKTEVYGEIGDLVNGTVEAYRDKNTVFKSQGMAIEDAVSAKLVYEKYMEQNQP
ncbi:ketimine reductase mu-crystallin-like [Glandiceps talaboti]